MNYRAAALAAVLLAAPAHAATFTVTRTDDPAPNGCAPGDCSLREAVVAANSAPDADEIVLGAGTHVLTRAGDGDASIGDLDIVAPVAIRGVSQAATIVDANGGATNDRAFSYQQAGAVSLADLTVTGGVADGGGCVKNTGADLTMTDVTVTNCEATGVGGGGIYNLAGGTLLLERCTVTDSSGGGGGLRNEGSPAPATEPTTATITDSLFAGNHAEGIGGAIFNVTNFALGSPPAVLVVTNSTIQGNSARDQAGGVANFTGGEMTLTNVTIVDNFYTQNGAVGGGVLSNGADDRLVNCTIANNGNDFTGMPTGNPWAQIIGLPEIANSLILGNGDPSCIESNPPASLGGNVAANPAAPMGMDGSCVLTHATDLESLPDLGLAASLADNGGATETLALLSGSPALGRGVAAYCPETDQRGTPRGDGCDAGAFQFCPADEAGVLSLLDAALAAPAADRVDWVPCLMGVPGR